jgi:hypothetical protein
MEGASFSGAFAIYFKAIAKTKPRRGAISNSAAQARLRLANRLASDLMSIKVQRLATS